MSATDKQPQSDRQPEPELIDLYQKPEKIYTRSFTGFFRNLRLAGGTFLFLLFFGTCWLNWGERQAVLFDLPARQFHIFGATFWPQDFILLSWILIICAFGLFTITVFAGRIWCGYTCPQSVFTWVFMWVERFTEGERNRRIKLDKQSLTLSKALKKLTKHLLWLAIAFATALTFVGYFTPVKELPSLILNGQAGSWVYFWLSFFTLATYGNAGWLREQVCLYMCPYARFQSVMFDNDTLVVAYDKQRGEQRGPRKRSANPKELGLGDCIDCTVCVQVCPTGIDIRDGLQYQCIGCAACVDACDTIMDKMGYEKGLIRYTTDTELTGGKTRTLRPRLAGYILALLTIIGLFAWTLADRIPLELEVIRDRNTLFRMTRDNAIENIYMVKVANKSQKDLDINIAVSGIKNLKLHDHSPFSVSAGEVAEHIIRITAPAEQGVATSRPITFNITTSDTTIKPLRSESRFMAPRTIQPKTNTGSNQ